MTPLPPPPPPTTSAPAAPAADAPTIPGVGTNDLLTIDDLSPDEVRSIFDLTAEMKRDLSPYVGVLAGKVVVLLFEKDSLRTKISFEAGVARLGGHAIYHNHMDCRIGERESVADYGKNLERLTDCIIARVFGHDVLEELAAASSVPVINALSDRFHPCQGLTDLFTLREKLGTLDAASIAYVGDANNVCNSLIVAGAKLGVDVTVISPAGYGPADSILSLHRSLARASGSTLTLTADLEAVQGSSAVYTDAWVSMGYEAEAARRHVAFAGYSVTDTLMDLAGPDALFMHCLPAHRGFEVAPEVLDGPRSIAFDQAENRMHVQNALLLHLLAPTAAG